MADANGNFPGDPGYDPSTDSGNTDNGDGTFTDGGGNVFDSNGNVISTGPGFPQQQQPQPGPLSPAEQQIFGGGYTDQSGAFNPPTPGFPQPAQQPAPVDPNTGQPAQQPAPAPGGGSNTVAGGRRWGDGGGPILNTPSSGGINGALGGLDKQLSALMGALSATNEQDFQEKVRQFNIGQTNWQQQFQANFGGVLPGGGKTLAAQAQEAGLTGMFNGQPTLAGKKTTADIAAQEAGLTGMFNGQPTLAGTRQQSELTGLFNGQPTPAYQQELANIFDTLQKLALAKTAQTSELTGLYNGQPTPAYQQELANITGMFNGNPTEQARQFNVNTQTDLAKLASSLTGPQDYYQYLNSLNQGRNIVGGLTGNQNVPQGAAPAGGTTGQSLQNIMGQLGINSGGASAGGASAGGGNAAAAATAPGGQSPQDMLSTLPHPSQIQPTYWDSLGTTGQSFMKGLYSAAGWNPADLETQINASRPAANNAQATQQGMSGAGFTQYASPASQSAFG